MKPSLWVQAAASVSLVTALLLGHSTPAAADVVWSYEDAGPPSCDCDDECKYLGPDYYCSWGPGGACSNSLTGQPTPCGATPPPADVRVSGPIDAAASQASQPADAGATQPPTAPTNTSGKVEISGGCAVPASPVTNGGLLVAVCVALVCCRLGRRLGRGRATGR